MSDLAERSPLNVYREFADEWERGPRLAWDTIAMRPTDGIPSRGLNCMEVPFLERLAGVEPGGYARDPVGVYLAFQRAAGACMIDQFIPRNPLTMGPQGYESDADRTATTGADDIVVDGMTIDSPEAVVEHMERVAFPRMEDEAAEFDPEDSEHVKSLIEAECATQRTFGTGILKGPYAGGFQSFPQFRYNAYGYVHYFSAYALYPEVMERDFSLQADVAALRNRAAARAVVEGGLPKLIRLDHDMADSRGTLVNIRSLEDIWFPHFARSIEPFLEADIRLLWHCDGNLMEMVPRLIEAGVAGFQGFQYEAGMDYPRICRLTDRDGGPLTILAGVSVTRTLPAGTPQDVAREMEWLVENGPRRGLFLGASSSITPGTPHENIQALIDGLAHYRERGRA